MTPSSSGPPPSNREQIRDVVGQLLKQQADKQQASRAEVAAARERAARQARRRGLQVVLLAIVLVISLLYAIPRWERPFARPTGARAERDARRAVLFAARLVDGRIRATGRAPLSFDEIGVTLPGISYHRLDSLSWVISVTVEGRTLSFQRGDDPVRFGGAP